MRYEWQVLLLAHLPHTGEQKVQLLTVARIRSAVCRTALSVVYGPCHFPCFSLALGCTP